MWGGSNRRLKHENALLIGELKRRAASEPTRDHAYLAPAAAIAAAVIGSAAAVAAAVIGFAAVAWAPVWNRQEELGVAERWTFSQYAGTSASPMLSVGDSSASISPDLAGVEAYNSGQLLLSLTAEPDRNYTVTDIELVLLDEAPKTPKWYYADPAASGPGSEPMANVQLGYLFAQDDWSNYAGEEGLFPGQKFDPLNLTSDTPATFSIAFFATETVSFKVILRYQENGSDEFETDTSDIYTIFGLDATVPTYTGGQDGLIRKMG